MRGEELLQQVSVRDLLPGSNLDDLLSYGHGVWLGMTDGGKTNALRYLAKNTRLLCVVWNPEDEPMPGVRCTSLDDLHAALKRKARSINYVPPEDEDAKLLHFAAVRQAVRIIGDRMRMRRGGSNAPPWCIFLVDEVQQLVTGKGDRRAVLVRALKEDRKRGVRYWMFTQEPSEVPQAVLTQTKVFALMEVKAFRVPYLEDYGIPMGVVWHHVQKPYHYALVVRNHYALCSPLPLA